MIQKIEDAPPKVDSWNFSKVNKIKLAKKKIEKQKSIEQLMFKNM